MVREWDDVAPYYDDLFEDRQFDVPFWVKLAKIYGSAVLELACGTGRLLIPMARAGVTVTGIDISGPMLAVARKKIRQEPAATRRRITLKHANVFSFSLRKKYAAIFSTWGFLPVTKAQQHNMLKSVSQHLTPGGVFVIDIENVKEPTGDWSYKKIREFKHIPGKHITLLRQSYGTGRASTKTGRIIFSLNIINRGGKVKRIISERKSRLYTKKDIIELLHAHGFREMQIYGDYNFLPYTPVSPNAIIIAKSVSPVNSRRTAPFHS